MHYLISFLLGLLCVSSTQAAAQTSFELQGSLRNLSQQLENFALSDQRTRLSSTLLRIESRYRQSPDLDVEMALQVREDYRDSALQAPTTTRDINHLSDVTRSWEQSHNWSGQMQIERFNLRGRRGNISWTLGRQAYGFGNILLFSPLDLVAPFAPYTLDTDYRPGVDALRFTLDTAQGDQFNTLAAVNRAAGQNSYLATSRINRRAIDLLFLGGSLRSRPMLGLGLAGNLGSLGIKAEMSGYQGKDVAKPGGDLHENFVIGALELWYRFDSGPILLLEYLYNGAGSSAAWDYLNAATSASFNEGLSPFLGRNYLLLSPSWEIHPLLTIATFGMWNLNDNSWQLRPQLQISLSDNFSLDLAHSFNVGAGLATGARPWIKIPQSEFGLYADTTSLFLRWYF